jgi:altronate dehydratase small subunit
MEFEQTAFQVTGADNVAIALSEIIPGDISVNGEAKQKSLTVAEKIPAGHKLSLREIKSGEDIVKYGVVIGRATADIPKGCWVHLHNMKSLYDERSSHLDARTGAPEDTQYN